ncbi:serine hydrolase domain-containing protein (plasmid) [Streptomyces sp. BI20]|uniref:serine hydrolase domain-containing protein n=1 Tax=Streptomyces sp. BI20 TaxID=3403460 RepID=UPI003C734B6A
MNSTHAAHHPVEDVVTTRDDPRPRSRSRSSSRSGVGRSSRRFTVPLLVGGAALSLLAVGVPTASAVVDPVRGRGTVTVPVSATITVPGPAFGRPLPEPAGVRALLDRMPDGVLDSALVRVSASNGQRPWVGATPDLDPDAVRPIGSVTKLYTGVVLLQLVAEGRIGFDDPVRARLPALIPAEWSKVTVRQLLDHTSDLPHPVPAPAEGNAPAAVVRASFAAVAPSERTPAPGTLQRYNGLNTLVAGLLIENLTGHGYADELRHRVTGPLGLRQTRLSSDPSVAWAWAEGGMESTPAETDRFLTALLGGRLLPAATQRHLFEVPDVPLAPTTSCPGDTACFSGGGLMRVDLGGGVVAWGKTGTMGPWTGGAFATKDLTRKVVYQTRPHPGAAGTAIQERLTTLAAKSLAPTTPPSTPTPAPMPEPGR